MTDHSAHGSHNVPATHAPADAPTPDVFGESNPEVRYERSDIQSRGVVVFVSVLAVLLVVFGFLLRGLFRLYQEHDDSVARRDALPLAVTGREQFSGTPRLEGVDPTRDVGRAWPTPTPADVARPWFGYNVRVVPAAGVVAASPDADPDVVDQLALEAMARKVQKVDTTLTDMAGKLPVRAGSKSLPTDLYRRSAGEGNAGRSDGEKAP